MERQPYTINVPESQLTDLRHRLKNTRWPNEVAPKGRQKGTELSFMKILVEYWVHDYEWKTIEKMLNRWNHLIANLQDMDIHFVHEKSKQTDSIPIVLLHGWGDSFYSYIHMIDPLTGQSNDHQSGGPLFDVVIPSLPGFAFSGQPPADQLTPTLVAQAIADLMEGLGYEQYIVHGGDWGSAVAQELARNHPRKIMGLHLNDIPFGNYYMVDRDQLSETEEVFFKNLDAWSETEMGYVAIQSTKPLTLSYGLNDSPVGLAAWIIEHFQRYSDPMPGKDDLITNVMLYWIENSIRSSIRYYNEGMGNDDWEENDASDYEDSDRQNDSWETETPDSDWDSETDMKINVPTAIACFPNNLATPPRVLAERFFDIRRYTKMDRGGHFAAMDAPELLEEDIREFVKGLAGNNNAPQ